MNSYLLLCVAWLFTVAAILKRFIMGEVWNESWDGLGSLKSSETARNSTKITISSAYDRIFDSLFHLFFKFPGLLGPCKFSVPEFAALHVQNGRHKTEKKGKNLSVNISRLHYSHVM